MTTQHDGSAPLILRRDAARFFAAAAAGLALAELNDGGMALRFDGETATMTKGGEDRDAGHKPDPTRTPRRIPFAPRDSGESAKSVTGISVLEGDTSRVAFRAGEKFDAPRTTSRKARGSARGP